MANLDSMVSFSEFPEDVQLSILSFLTPSEISSFACTSKRFLALCRNDSKLWFSMCDRRWGSKTQIKKWGSGNIAFKHLYKTLHEYDNLIGFWRLSSIQKSPNTISVGSNSNPNQPPTLIFFEWGKSFITGSRVSPSNNGTSCYDVIKSPFLWMGISPKGEIVNFLEPNSQLQLDSDSIQDDLLLSGNGNELVSVDINHMGEFHIVIEQRVSFGNGKDVNERVLGLESGSPPDRLTSEMYRYFANRTSPGGGRRQRRRDKGNNNKKWEAEHFVKIVNYSPTSLRPLQGLWKGICEDANLDFYLVVYDDIGGIACRRIGDSCKPFSSYAPVFWTSNTTFFESPFSSEEEYIYDTREHLLPAGHLAKEDVSRIMYINSSYDLVLPGLTTVNPHQVEGRIWQYGDGTFGFGFLRDNHIIDLKHIAVDGCLLDAIKPL